MLKVCMIVQKYYHNDSRVKRYAEALASAGARVDVLCLEEPNQSANTRGGIRLFPIPVGRGAGGPSRYLLKYGAGLAIFSARLLPLHWTNRYDVIHVHNMPDSLILAALIPRLLGAKLILDIHDPMPEVYQSKYRSSTTSVAVHFMRLQEKLSCKLAHAVITANSNFKENLALRGIPAERITVINNLPDPAIFDRSAYARTAPDKNQFTLIYPGTIAPRYGLAVAIRALPELSAQIPGLRMIIIGEDVGHTNHLRQLAEELGVTRFVQFRPHVPVDEVPRQMIEADVGIYPALPDAHMSIAMPVKVMEYAAMGLPIVTSRLKVVEDSFGDAAMCFEPGRPEDFARCVLDLYHNPGRRAELVRNADSVASSQNWKTEQRVYFGLLNRLTSKARLLAPLVTANGPQ